MKRMFVLSVAALAMPLLAQDKAAPKQVAIVNGEVITVERLDHALEHESGLEALGGLEAPLGLAVIGGLLLATVSTLLFVPVMYSLLRRQPPRPLDPELDTGGLS